MQTILMVTEAKSYFPITIKKKLENLGYGVETVSADTDAIHRVKVPICAIVIYADEPLIKETQPLNYLKDKAITDDVPIFAVGDNEELKAIEIIIPKDLIRQEFPRPIYVNEMIESINGTIKIFSQETKKKILVVDDSGPMLRNVKGWLEGKYSVFLANSGAMAIKYLALNRPDLVLLDYEMPVVDGKQVLEMIRSETEFADVPVIFLTVKEDKESILMVQPFKPDGYLLKTMRPQQIVKAVDDFFFKKKWNM